MITMSLEDLRALIPQPDFIQLLERINMNLQETTAALVAAGLAQDASNARITALTGVVTKVSGEIQSWKELAADLNAQLIAAIANGQILDPGLQAAVEALIAKSPATDAVLAAAETAVAAADALTADTGAAV